MKTCFLLSMIVAASLIANAQCSILETATETNLVLQCAGGTNNRSGLAFHPGYQLYYSVNAGSSSYPIETYDSGGNLVATVASGFDYRGLWFNPNDSTIVGNGYYSSGLCTHTLSDSGYATGFVNIFLAGTFQPSPQSCGAYDYDADEILYFANGMIYRYSPANGDLLGTVSVTGLPVDVTNIDSTSLGFTGCTGKEIVLYDFVNRAVYFIDKASGDYVGTSQLPGTAYNPDRFMFSFCNRRAWVFDGGALQWKCYEVLSTAEGIADADDEVSVSIFPNPMSNIASVEIHAHDTPLNHSRFVMHDVFGNEVINEEIKTNRFNFSRNGLAAGIYWWQVSSDTEVMNGIVRTGKLVVQ